MTKENTVNVTPIVEQSDIFAVPAVVIDKSNSIGMEITKSIAKSKSFRRDKITELATLLKQEYGLASDMLAYTDRNPLYILSQVEDRIRSEYELGVLAQRKELKLIDFRNTRTIGNISGEVIKELKENHCIHFNAKGKAPQPKVISDAEKANAEAKQAIKDAKKALMQDVRDTFDEASNNLRWLKTRALGVRDDNGRAEYTTDAKLAVDVLKKIHKAISASVDKLSS